MRALPGSSPALYHVLGRRASRATAMGKGPSRFSRIVPRFGSLPDSSRGTRSSLGSGWSSWSHSYSNDVYFCNLTNCPGDIMTVNLPFNTNAFSFDVESNNFNPTPPATGFTFIVDATGSNAPGTTTAVTIAPNGVSSARYVGFYSKAPSRGGLLQSLKITCLGNCNGFAIGEFKINQSRLTQP